MSFDILGLSDELLKTVTKQGYTTPSQIQAEAIPVVLSRRDVMAVAHTGTGKTAAFTLPVIQLLSAGTDTQALSVRALVITPTRELAAQVAENVQHCGNTMNIRTGTAFGGVRIEPQITKLQDGVDVLVATPGRLIDLYNQQAINFDQLEILVLDEADRMLDLGFIDDIRHIQKLLPTKRQTLMFSATFSEDIKSLAKGMLNDPLLIEVATEKNILDNIKQKMHPVDKERKSELLIHLIRKYNWHQLLVFSRTKRGADALVIELKEAGINAESIHANRTQHARTRALDGFRNGSVVVLVATDIASRGIDVHQLPCVINFDLPYVPEDYVHRIGRTGRAGTSGLAVSFFSEDESKQLGSIERLIGRKFERDIVQGFAPNKKTPIELSDEDEEYGNFEPDPPRRKGKSKGHAGKPAKTKRKHWKEYL